MNVGYTIIGLILLLVVPFVFHFFAFGKKVNLASLLISVLVGDGILTVVAMLAGLLGLFYGFAVLILSIAIAALLGFYLKKKIKVKGPKIGIESVIITALFAFFLWVCQQVSGFVLLNDALGKYLPYSRIIMETHGIPAIFTQGLYFKMLNPLPLLYMHTSYLFSIAGVQEGLAAAIPISFSALSVLLLITWAKQYKEKLAYLFIIPVLLVSYEFLLSSQSLYVEAPLLFFATAAFYFMKRFLDKENTLDLCFMFIALSLATMSKISGLVLTAVIFIVLLIKAKDRTKLLYISFLFFLPVLLWLARNFIVYNNPFFMSFSSTFPGVFNMYRQAMVFDPGVHIGYAGFVKNLFWQFPVFIFALVYMIKQKRDLLVRVVFISFIVSVIFVGVSESVRILVRYQYHFFGIFALFGALLLAHVYSRIKIRYKKPLLYAATAIIMVAVVVATLYFPGVVERKQFMLAEKGVAEYLGANDTGNDFLILSDGSVALEWFGNYKVIDPGVALYLKVFQNKNFDFNEKEDYYYDFFTEHNIKYIYDSPAGADISGTRKHKVEQMQHVFDAIEEDSRFELVYKTDETRLWRVVA